MGCDGRDCDRNVLNGHVTAARSCECDVIDLTPAVPRGEHVPPQGYQNTFLPDYWAKCPAPPRRKFQDSDGPTPAKKRARYGRKAKAAKGAKRDHPDGWLGRYFCPVAERQGRDRMANEGIMRWPEGNLVRLENVEEHLLYEIPARPEDRPPIREWLQPRDLKNDFEALRRDRRIVCTALCLRT